MKGGGKNTKMETNAAGARTLVTTVGDKTYKLNISNITNGLKTNPNQMIFNTVSDDSNVTDTYLSAMGLSGKTLDLPALVNTGILKKESRLVPVAGKSNEIYTVDRDEAYRVVAGLSENLVKDPASYNYTNSIWQDKLGKSITLKQALASEGEEKVLKQIREYYVEEAIGASIANGISAQLPRPEKRVKKSQLEESLTALVKGNIRKVPTKTKNQYWEVEETEKKALAGESNKVITKYVDVIIGNEVKKVKQQEIPLYVKGKINLSGWKAANSEI